MVIGVFNNYIVWCTDQSGLFIYNYCVHKVISETYSISDIYNMYLILLLPILFREDILDYLNPILIVYVIDYFRL